MRRAISVVLVGALLFAGAACSSGGSAKAALPVATTASTRPPVSNDPCAALSSSDLESTLGGTAGTGHGDGNSCTWLMDGGRVAAVVYTREPHVSVPDPVNVSGVGDGANLSADGTTLAVVKRPDLAFTVNITPTSGTAAQAEDELKGLANAVISNEDR